MRKVYRVMAAVNGPMQPWVKILTTADKAYADATVDQFKEADIRVRIETLGKDA